MKVGRRQRRQHDFAHGIADRGLMADHALQRIQGDVAGQHREQPALRLEGMDRAHRSDHVAERDRVRSDVGTDVDHGVTELDVVAQQLDLEVAPLAVEVEPASDEIVVAAEHEDAVAAVLHRDVPVFKQIRRQHGTAFRGSLGAVPSRTA